MCLETITDMLHVAIAHGAQQTRPAPKRGAQPPRCHSGSVSHSHPRTDQVCSSELDYLKLKKRRLLASGMWLVPSARTTPQPRQAPSLTSRCNSAAPPPLPYCSIPRHAFPTPAWCQPAHSSSPPSPTEVALSLAKPAHMRIFSIMQLDGHNAGNGKSHHGNTVILPVIPRVLLPWYYYCPAIRAAES